MTYLVPGHSFYALLPNFAESTTHFKKHMLIVVCGLAPQCVVIFCSDAELDKILPEHTSKMTDTVKVVQ